MRHYTHPGRPDLNEIFERAVEKYLDLVKNKLSKPVPTGLDRQGILRDSSSLPGATFAQLSFTHTEQEYFYQAYDALWSGGAKIEAYCLMRLVYGILSRACIEKLYRAGHLFTYRDIYAYTQGA